LWPKTLHYIEVFGHKQRMRNKLKITAEEYVQLEKGECDDLTIYVKCLAYFLRKLVPMKIELKSVPSGLPTKNEIIGMMNGEVQYTEQYIQTIDTLIKLPDLPRKIVPKVKIKQPIISEKKGKTVKRHVVDFKKWPKGDVVAKERRRKYGMESQITRKEWGSAYRPARIK
jgi:hypothetical protein